MKFLVPVLMALLLTSGVFASYLAVSHEGTPIVGEENTYLVTVSDRDTGDAIAGAKVALIFKYREVAALETDDDGTALFHLLPKSGGILEFRVSYADYNDYVIVENITPVSEPEPEPVVDEPAPVDEVSNDTASVTGFLTEDASENSVFVFLFGVIAVALVVFGYYFYTREDEDVEPESMTLEERYDLVKSELETI